MQNIEQKPSSPPLRRRGVALFFIGWTILAALATYWLMHSAAKPPAMPETLFDSSQSAQVPVSEQVRRWLKIADLNFRGAYPWILMAPYIFWLGSRFLLERERLRLSLPVHLLGCVLFAATSSALTTRVVEKKNITVMMTHREGTLRGTRDILTNFPSAKLHDVITNGPMRVETYTSDVAGVRAKLVVSSSVATIPTNLIDELTASATVQPAPDPKINPAPAADFDLHGVLSDAARGQAGGWIGSARTSFRQDARLFSHFLNILAYGSLIGLAHAVHFYRRARERERQAVLLQSHLAQARLHALQAQLQPHFLFNALNAVATLLRRDPRAAQEALTSFSELLRLALSQSDKQEVPLSDDLRFVERYVEIQQMRLGDRLRFEQQVQPDTLDCLVPALLLQPLVENALRHGIEPSPKPGLVRIIVSGQDSKLDLTVEDDGVGLSETQQRHAGIGLTNLRARLEALYDGQHKLEVRPRTEGGVCVQIEIPMRQASAAENK